MNQRLITVIGALGRFFIGAGLIVLAFAAYQLWGTGLQEGRAQSALADEFADRQAALAELDDPAIVALPVDDGSTAGTSPSGTTVPSGTGAEDSEADAATEQPPATLPIELAPELADELIPDNGEALGVIRIPRIGVEKTVVEGVGRDDLRKGPGHYPETPFPGQAGNAAIAGHRTTYGAPFYDLDLLEPGDTIEVDTLQGTFYYEVLGYPGPDGADVGYLIVDDSAVEVVSDQGDDRLTLTACHPKYSARQRIVVSALMVGAPAPTLVVQAPVEVAASDGTAGAAADESGVDETVAIDAASPEADALEESLGWHMEELPGVLTWGAACAAVFLAGWLLGRFWRRWPAYALITPVFLVGLWVAFGHLDRLLPAF